MIKINLYHRKAAVGVVVDSSGATPATGLKGLIDKLKGGAEGIGDEKKAIIILGVVYAAIYFGVYWYVGSLQEEMIAAVEAEISTLNSKTTLLTSELNKTNGYEQIKKSLEADEKTIRTKIETIQELIRDRSTPPKILTTLSEATPKDVWLREFSLQSRHFKIAGNSISMEVVSDFMKSLEETIYFKTVVLKSSKQEATVKGARALAVFELEAERR